MEKVPNMPPVSNQLPSDKPVTMSRTGMAIAAQLAQRDADARALLARALVTGEPFPRQSHRQAAKLTVVSRHRLAAAELATVSEIECVQLGRLSLRHVRAAHAKPKNKVNEILSRYSVDAIMAAADRLTAPALSAAAE